jgi:recombination protein RecA
VAWVCERHSCFFPPDLAAAGVDVSALAVVRVEDGGRVWRACDTLLRSGGFALVVADFNGPLRLPFAAQTRLAGLAQRHNTALVTLTREVEARHSVGRKGSLVSLRAQTAKHRAGHDCFVCEACVVKDKRRPPGWMHEELCCGVEGVC